MNHRWRRRGMLRATMAIEHTVLCTFAGDVLADDVAVAALPDGALACAYSAVTDDREEGVYLARVAANGTSAKEGRLSPAGSRAFRPAIASAPDGSITVAACMRLENEGRYAPWVVVLPTDIDPAAGPTPAWRRLEHDGSVALVALAMENDGVVAAWEERNGSSHRVVVAAIDGGSRTVLEGARAPALGAGHLAWVDAQDRIQVASVTDLEQRSSPGEAGALPDALALTGGPDGSLVVAWHAQVGPADAPDVLRWLRMFQALEATGPWTPIPTGPAAEDVDARGEDQGWEFPAVLTTGGHRLLAGRSCQGWHVAAWRGDDYMGRTGISPYGWGGRGRTVALATGPGDTPWVIRRESRGIAVSRLDVSGDPVPPPTAAAPEPLQIPGPAPKETAVLFGDLHQHAVHSDACGTAESVYAWSRDRRALDFAALTEHDRFCRRDIGPGHLGLPLPGGQRLRRAGALRDVPRLRVHRYAPARTGTQVRLLSETALRTRVPEKDVEALFAVSPRAWWHRRALTTWAGPVPTWSTTTRSCNRCGRSARSTAPTSATRAPTCRPGPT